jgi:hypothetical protein
MPTFSTSSPYDNLFSDYILKEINAYVVQGAIVKKLIHDPKLWENGTVIEVDIHYPTDSSHL